MEDIIIYILGLICIAMVPLLALAILILYLIVIFLIYDFIKETILERFKKKVR